MDMAQARRRKVFTVFGAVLVTCAAVLVFRPPCLILKTFGVLCPACGTTHMALSLLQGDLQGAYRENPLMLFLLPTAVVFGGVEAVRYVREKRLLSTRPVAWVLFALVLLGSVAFAVYRNLAL